MVMAACELFSGSIVASAADWVASERFRLQAMALLPLARFHLPLPLPAPLLSCRHCLYLIR